MRKLILINGDIATGKSRLALLTKERFSLPLYTKDEFKEKYAEEYPYSTYEESHKLSIMAMDTLFDHFLAHAKKGEDVILEANFHEEHLLRLEKIVKEYGYQVLDIDLVGSPKVLYERYIDRMNDGNRHPVHKVNDLKDYEYFERYTLSRRDEKRIGIVISVNADTFDYQKDESLYQRIEKFLKGE